MCVNTELFAWGIFRNWTRSRQHNTQKHYITRGSVAKHTRARQNTHEHGRTQRSLRNHFGSRPWGTRRPRVVRGALGARVSALWASALRVCVSCFRGAKVRPRGQLCSGHGGVSVRRRQQQARQ
eukprot:1270238-Pyramimonas_sp.AAC.1